MFDTNAQTQTLEAVIAALLMLTALSFVMLAYIPQQQGYSAVQLQKYGEDALMLISFYPAVSLTVNSTTGNLSWTDEFNDNKSIATSTNLTVSGGDAKIAAAEGNATRCYEFSGITKPSFTHVARYDTDDASLEAATVFDTTGGEFDNTAYQQIHASDNSRAVDSGGSGDYAQHIFRFKVVESKTSLSRLSVTWEGYSQYGVFIFWTGVTTSNGVRIWNHTASSWEILGDVQSSEATVSNVYTNISQISNYIDDNGYVFLMAYAYKSGSRTRIRTDYVKLEVDYSGYKSSANLTSISITTSSSRYWKEFFAHATLPSGANITYTILNATDNSTICDNISAADAANGYDLSSCTCGVMSIRLHANLTSDTSNTPLLHEWGVNSIPSSSVVLDLESQDWNQLDEEIAALLPDNIEYNFYFLNNSGGILEYGSDEAKVEHGLPGRRAVSTSKLVYAKDPRGTGYNIYEVQLDLWYR
jgi:hypothetical protein